VSYLRKYFIKGFFLVGFSLLLLNVVVLVAANSFLLKSKSQVEDYLKSFLGKRVSVENIYYFPPNFITFKNLTILDGISAGDKQIFSAQRVQLQFSLVRLIKKGDFAISGLYFKRPQTDYASCRQFLQNNKDDILLRAKRLSNKGAFKLTIKDGSLNVSGKNSQPSIRLNASLKIKDGKVLSDGRIDLGEAPLTYKIKGILTKGALSIENFNLKHANFSTKLRGQLKEGTLNLDGFCLLSQPPINLAFFDLSTLIKFDTQKIRIENFSSSWKTMPFSLQGDIFISDPVRINLTLSSGKMKSTVKNLSFYFPEEDQLGISFGEALANYTEGIDLSGIPFKDFNALVDLKDKKAKFLKFNSKIYDGLLEGEGYIRKTPIPLRCALVFKTENVSMNKLRFSSMDFSNVYGKSESRFRLISYPRPNLNGQLIIHEGYLDNVQFFSWLSDFFQLAVLKRVDFDTLSARFSADSRAIVVDELNLDSKDVNLNGNFSLDKDKLVSGRISLDLSRGLLEISPSFRPLLGLLQPDASFLRFDFQLSGLLESMNFKWLESDFKMNLQDMLSETRERGLEKGVEDIIDSISTKDE